MPRLSPERIEASVRTIDPVFLNSAQFEAESIGADVGVRLTLKNETDNPIRSFKGRGADFYVQTLADPPARFVCASAGNFGQAMAYAATRRGIPCDVFASTNANSLKVERMRALGATVRQTGDDFDAAKAAGRRHAESLGLPFIEDGREAPISEGAGSIALELLRDDPSAYDSIVVPLGNGALLGGIATWVKHAAPRTRVIGVVAAGAPSMELSWRAHRATETERADTIADGIAVRVPIPEAVDDLQDIVDDMVRVDDASIVRAMQLLFAHLRLAVEPAGAVGLAALVEHRDRFEGQRVATVLCGANLTDAQRAAYGLVESS